MQYPAHFISPSMEIYWLSLYFNLRGSTVLEMGAQWIHGEENNPVYEFAAKHDLVRCDEGLSRFFNLTRVLYFISWILIIYLDA